MPTNIRMEIMYLKNKQLNNSVNYMNFTATSIRSFIGSKDFNISRKFYATMGFNETVLNPKMSLFEINDKLAFYLQDYYHKDWIENTMLFVEVEDLKECLASLQSKKIVAAFEGVKLSGIVKQEWGSELFLHDPAGILWHFGTFSK